MKCFLELISINFNLFENIYKTEIFYFFLFILGLKTFYRNKWRDFEILVNYPGLSDCRKSILRGYIICGTGYDSTIVTLHANLA